MRGALDASAIPKHRGRATKKTTILDEKSDFKFLNIYVHFTLFKPNVL
jgi:hypothetical protein